LSTVLDVFPYFSYFFPISSLTSMLKPWAAWAAFPRFLLQAVWISARNKKAYLLDRLYKLGQ
jgi:hypothetical protein